MKFVATVQLDRNTLPYLLTNLLTYFFEFNAVMSSEQH